MVVDHQQTPDALRQPEIFIAARSVFLKFIENHQRVKTNFAARGPSCRRISYGPESGHKQ